MRSSPGCGVAADQGRHGGGSQAVCVHDIPEDGEGGDDGGSVPHPGPHRGPNQGRALSAANLRAALRACDLRTLSCSIWHKPALLVNRGVAAMWQGRSCSCGCMSACRLAGRPPVLHGCWRDFSGFEEPAAVEDTLLLVELAPRMILAFSSPGARLDADWLQQLPHAPACQDVLRLGYTSFGRPYTPGSSEGRNESVCAAFRLGSVQRVIVSGCCRCCQVLAKGTDVHPACLQCRESVSVDSGALNPCCAAMLGWRSGLSRLYCLGKAPGGSLRRTPVLLASSPLGLRTLSFLALHAQTGSAGGC